MDVKRITLGGGETGTVSFFVTNTDPGHYSVEVEGLPGEFDVFSKIASDDLSLADLKVLLRGRELAAGATVEPGDPLRFSVTVLNDGAIDGVAGLEFRINGVLTELRALALPARGRLEDVRFDFTPPRRRHLCSGTGGARREGFGGDRDHGGDRAVARPLPLLHPGDLARRGYPQVQRSPLHSSSPT